MQIALQRLLESRAEVENISQMSESAKSQNHTQRLKSLDPSVKKLYTELAQLLQCYRSGQLPRAFKALVHSPDWEDLLMLMKPESWTPAALKACTEVFTTGACPDSICQRLYNMILLPRCRDEIHEFRKLNVYLNNVIL